MPLSAARQAMAGRPLVRHGMSRHPVQCIPKPSHGSCRLYIPLQMAWHQGSPGARLSTPHTLRACPERGQATYTYIISSLVLLLINGLGVEELVEALLHKRSNLFLGGGICRTQGSGAQTVGAQVRTHVAACALVAKGARDQEGVSRGAHLCVQCRKLNKLAQQQQSHGAPVYIPATPTNSTLLLPATKLT